jgi:hypothetical protein
VTLAYLQELVTGARGGYPLTGDLTGWRKLAVPADDGEWRIVYVVRPAPAASPCQREIHVLAVRPRAGNDVYDTVGRRLGMTRRPLSARTHAARSRSPQLPPAPVPSGTGARDPAPSTPAGRPGHANSERSWRPGT